MALPETRGSQLALSIPLQIGEKDHMPAAFFPSAITDFSESAEGNTGYDLANAYYLDAVVRGDVIEITVGSQRQKPDDQSTHPLVYRGPLELGYGGERGGHMFVEPENYGKFVGDIPITGEELRSWKKIDHLEVPDTFVDGTEF